MKLTAKGSKLVLSLSCIIVCAHLAQTQLYLPSFLDLEEFSRGAAEKPYQYRILTAVFLNIFYSYVAPVFEPLTSKLTPPYNVAISAYKYISSLLYLAVTCSCVFFASEKVGLSNKWSWFSMFACLYMTYFNLSIVGPSRFYLPYDLPGLMFFSLILFLTCSTRFFLIIPFFIIATLNRETSILYLTPLVAYFISEKQKNKSILAVLILCVISWIAIKLALAQVFASSPGESLQFQLGYNYKVFLLPQRFTIFSSVFGFLWIPIFLYGWRIGPIWVRYSFLTYVIWFIGMIFVGVLIEIRIFSELSALAALHISFVTQKLLRE